LYEIVIAANIQHDRDKGWGEGISGWIFILLPTTPNVNKPNTPVNKPPFAVDTTVDSLFPINVFLKCGLLQATLVYSLSRPFG
jgi:hypothetical protein